MAYLDKFMDLLQKTFYNILQEEKWKQNQRLWIYISDTK